MRAVETHAARHWLLLAVGVLVMAGVFAVLLVAGRMPGLDLLVTDPLWFKRVLVVHVNLALVCWFYSFVAALLFLLPGRDRSSTLSRLSPGIAAAGVGLMCVAAWLPGTSPVLSNYIPVIDHPLFGVGQLLFGAGVLASFLDRRLIDEDEPDGFYPLPVAARPGLVATAIALVLAALTLAASALTVPAGLDVHTHYELLMWGPGHVLQLASVLAMVSVWILLLTSALGQPVISRDTARWLFFLLVAPWTASPLLTLVAPTGSYLGGFTALMRWCLFPMMLVFLALCLRALFRGWLDGRVGPSSLLDVRVTGFGISAVLTLLGFGLGAAISGSNTIIPAHYHAAIGAVTASFMAVSYVLLEPVGLRLPERARPLAAVQPVLFGAGQTIFASGFAMAGAFGMARKAYGAEQAARGLFETIGLAIMGVGGLVAVVGGALFLLLMVAAWRGRVRIDATASNPIPSWRFPWSPTSNLQSTRSRS